MHQRQVISRSLSAHSCRIAPAHGPDKPRSRMCGHCTGPSWPRTSCPAAWGDGAGPAPPPVFPTSPPQRATGRGRVSAGRVHVVSRTAGWQVGRRRCIRRTVWPLPTGERRGRRRPVRLAPAVLAGGTMVSGCAGGVRDVFAGLTHSQICCVHGPFRPVQMNRGRRVMRGKALVVHTSPAIGAKRFRFRNCQGPLPGSYYSRRSIQCRAELSPQRPLPRCGS
jgi:hypothetical protein